MRPSKPVYVTHTVCPHCNTKHDRSTNISEVGEPEPGDASLCMACGRWAFFDDRKQLRKPSSEEMDDLAKKIDLARVHEDWVLATTMQGKVTR